MERRLCGIVLSLLALGLLQTNAFEVEIKDNSNKTCMYASMNVNFTIRYDNTNGTNSTVTYSSTDSVTTDGSSCEGPLLKVNFGNGHSWSLNFTKNETLYRGDFLTFTYNTNDTSLFPDAKRNGLLTSITQTSFFSPVPLNSLYKCLHEAELTSDRVVQLYWNVTLQAFVQNSTLGKEFRCSADNPTTAVPPTSNVTIPSTTNPPKPTPQPVDKPTVGNYSVSNATGMCLLASMGVQLNVSMLEGKNVWTAVNINPNTTVSSGRCGNETALLRLNDNNVTIVEFYFVIQNKRFHLDEVNVNLTNGSGIFHRAIFNLSLWEASSGNSYLCHKEQFINVSEDLSINTFEVRVQPFGVNNGTYSTASQCRLDDDSILIPIIVGAALSGLIIIIVIAYLIGRRKTYAGYQTL